jgi:CubicO group peptidase (beta-lactamase class C family)
MPMPLARAVVAMLILMILPAAAGSSPSPSFTSWLETQMMKSNIPGISIAVIKDYRVEWAAGFGMSDKARQVKVTPDTLFQAASVSKAISAIAVMIALEEHRLSVNDEVNATLAKFPPEESVGQWRLRNSFSTKVTLRMLLSHIGGTNDFRYSGYHYGYYNNPPGPIEPIPTMHQELTGLPPSNTPAIEVVREPGLTWVYSPAGYTVIQAILMNIYGKPFSEIMADVVLKPLHLRESTFDQPTPSALTPKIAVPYVTDGQPLPDGPRVFDTTASGGLTITPTELAELVIAVQRALAGTPQGRITPEIAKAMMVRQPGETLPSKCLPSSEPNKPACQSSWGLGFDVNLTRYYEHERDGQPTGAFFGHGGFNSGYLTIMFGSKTGGIGMVIMVNVAPEDMSGDVPQLGFLMSLVRRVAEEEGW